MVWSGYSNSLLGAQLSLTLSALAQVACCRRRYLPMWVQQPDQTALAYSCPIALHPPHQSHARRSTLPYSVSPRRRSTVGAGAASPRGCNSLIGLHQPASLPSHCIRLFSPCSESTSPLPCQPSQARHCWRRRGLPISPITLHQPDQLPARRSTLPCSVSLRRCGTVSAGATRAEPPADTCPEGQQHGIQR